MLMCGTGKIVVLTVATLALLLMTLLLVRIEPLMATAVPGVLQVVATMARMIMRGDHSEGGPELTVEVGLPDSDL